MEVIHLNAEGLKKYCETYGNTIYNVSTDFKGIPEAWKMDTPEGIAEVYNTLDLQNIVSNHYVIKLSSYALILMNIFVT